jgi:hypothetical protein
MAKSNPRGGRGQPARAAAKSKKSASAEVAVGDDKPGIGIETGMAILTAILLLGAIVLVDKMQGLNGDGIVMNQNP